MAQTNNSNKSSTKDEYFSADNRFQNKDPYDHPSFRKQEDASVFEPHALDSFEEKIDSFFQSEDFSNLSDSLGEAVSKGIETAITGAAVGLSHYSNVLNDLL
ncbi:MAG: hypothetical protein Q4E22_05445, partial [Coriobacteriia bacterium]|nr:hypothetical protein [Coriobacteriia bacterium]